MPIGAQKRSVMLRESKSRGPIADAAGESISPSVRDALSRIKATGKTIGGKPVIEIPSRILNTNSGFAEKGLCTGPTMSAGNSCAYLCPYCYVGPMMARQPAMIAAKMAAGGMPHEDMVVRRMNAPESLRAELLTKKTGAPRKICQVPHVVYTSPLVDCAATIELARETLEMCLVVLENTVWHIRLLSKSTFLPYIAQRIPEEHQQRMIYGVSTGTLDDKLGRSEQGTPLVSKRIASLRKLQDMGCRTFGMICPVLPQRDYDRFAQEAAEAIDFEACEHVWVEVLNPRGASMHRTYEALRALGYEWESDQLELARQNYANVWEDYARHTFLAFSEIVPPAKLRFLQYPIPQHLEWWKAHERQGAVLLGSAAHG